MLVGRVNFRVIHGKFGIHSLNSCYKKPKIECIVCGIDWHIDKWWLFSFFFFSFRFARFLFKCNSKMKKSWKNLLVPIILFYCSIVSDICSFLWPVWKWLISIDSHMNLGLFFIFYSPQLDATTLGCTCSGTELVGN